MPIKFSDHAEFQLKKRKISQKLVKLAIKKPSRILPSFKGRKLRQLSIGGKILEVITKTEGSRIVMKMKYDPEVDVVYIELAKGVYKVSRKISDSVVVDEDKNGKVLGIEILDAKKNISSFDPKKTEFTIQDN